MTKSPSATITPGSYLRDAGLALMRLKRPSRPGSMWALCYVVRRPISQGLLIIPFVEECIECFKNKRFVPFFRRRHLSCSCSRRLIYLVDPVRVEGDVILDLCHRFKWGLISPHRVA